MCTLGEDAMVSFLEEVWKPGVQECALSCCSMTGQEMWGECTDSLMQGNCIFLGTSDIQLCIAKFVPASPTKKDSTVVLGSSCSLHIRSFEECDLSRKDTNVFYPWFPFRRKSWRQGLKRVHWNFVWGAWQFEESVAWCKRIAPSQELATFNLCIAKMFPGM